MRKEKIGMTSARGTTRKTKNHTTREETMVERLILVMNGTPEMKALVKRKGRKLQQWLSRNFPLPQGCSTTCPMMKREHPFIVSWPRARR
jgi:hypothetical protein